MGTDFDSSRPARHPPPLAETKTATAALTRVLDPPESRALRGVACGAGAWHGSGAREGAGRGATERRSGGAERGAMGRGVEPARGGGERGTAQGATWGRAGAAAGGGRCPGLAG